VAVVVALAGGSRLVALLALLAAGLLALLATPTVRDGGDDGDDGVDGDGDGGRRAIPPQVMVVTAEGLIGRDERGLRRWRFEELATVFTGGHDERPHLVLVDRRGARHAIDHLRYHDGERLPELIDAGMRRGRR
jgi:hypothetical protein